MNWRWKKDISSPALFTKACKAAGTRNLIAELLDPFRLLVSQGRAPDDVKAALSLFQDRPWYSADELAMLWPMICIGLAAKDRAWRPTPDELAKRLVQCGLPRLQRWDGFYLFQYRGRMQEFFIVQDVRRIAKMRFMPVDFDRLTP